MNRLGFVQLHRPTTLSFPPVTSPCQKQKRIKTGICSVTQAYHTVLPACHKALPKTGVNRLGFVQLHRPTTLSFPPVTSPCQKQKRIKTGICSVTQAYHTVLPACHKSLPKTEVNRLGFVQLHRPTTLSFPPVTKPCQNRSEKRLGFVQLHRPTTLSFPPVTKPCQNRSEKRLGFVQLHRPTTLSFPPVTSPCQNRSEKRLGFVQLHRPTTLSFPPVTSPCQKQK